MRHATQSFRHALEGLTHAFRRERNLRLFLCAYAAVIVTAVFLPLTSGEWALLVLSGSVFTAIELINTALERLVDAVDQSRNAPEKGYHPSLKATKDVASAAALAGLCGVIAVVAFVVGPHITATL